MKFANKSTSSHRFFLLRYDHLLKYNSFAVMHGSTEREINIDRPGQVPYATGSGTFPKVLKIWLDNRHSFFA